MNEIVLRLKQKHSAHKQLKIDRLSQYQEVAEYFQPERATFYGTVSKESENREKLFDSTPEDANETLAAQLQANMVSSVFPWFGLEISDEDELDQDEKEWLEHVEKKMLEKFNSGETGFQTAMHEFFLDYPVFGIAGLFIDNPSPGKLRFICEPISSYVVAENADGKVDTIFRELEWTVRQIYETWPKTCSPAIKDLYEQNKCNEKFVVIHAIEPRKKFSQKPKRGKEMPIGSYYYEDASGIMLDESGFMEDAFLSPRWAKKAKDPYGRGLGQKALPDARVLQEIERSGLIAAEKQADPTTLLPHDGFIGNWDSDGGALNFHRMSGDIREKVMTIGSEAKLEVFQGMSEQKRMAIRKIFLNDKIAPIEKEMTATEYVGNYKQNMQILGPMFSRAKPELLEPMIVRVFNVMYRDGEFDQTPDSLKGKPLKIKYLSPIEREQKQVEAQAFTQAINYLAPMATAFPAVGQAMIRHFDVDHLVRNTQPMFGYSVKNLRPMEKIKKEDEANAAAANAQQEKVNAAQDMELAGKAKELTADEQGTEAQ